MRGAKAITSWAVTSGVGPAKKKKTRTLFKDQLCAQSTWGKYHLVCVCQTPDYIMVCMEYIYS
jgi:hypothetical protein